MMWTYMGMQIHPNELPALREILAMLEDGGASNAALETFREACYTHYGRDLVWLFPISEGESAGGLILPVQEGMLWIPYDEVSKDDGELLILKDAHLLDAEECAALRTDMESYALGLCNMLREAEAICAENARKED